MLRDNFPNKKIYSLAGNLPQFKERLGECDIVDEETIKNSLAIIIDCSEIERVSDQRVKFAKQIIKIDHHIESKPFYGIKWVDEDSIATCQMIAEFGFETKKQDEPALPSKIQHHVITAVQNHQHRH